MAAERKYRWVCTTCGSANVNCSGTLHWSYGKQAWIFEGVPLDDDFCEDCEDECRVEQRFDDEVFWIRGGEGDVAVNPINGKIISRTDPGAYPTAVRFNVKEYRAWVRGGGNGCVDEADITDIGYWEVGGYNPSNRDEKP